MYDQWGAARESSLAEKAHPESTLGWSLNQLGRSTKQSSAASPSYRVTRFVRAADETTLHRPEMYECPRIE
jgi:hypothetical protein